MPRNMSNNIPSKCQINAKQCAKQYTKQMPNKCQANARQIPNNMQNNIPNKCQTNAKQMPCQSCQHLVSLHCIAHYEFPLKSLHLW